MNEFQITLSIILIGVIACGILFIYIEYKEYKMRPDCSVCGMKRISFRHLC